MCCVSCLSFIIRNLMQSRLRHCRNIPIHIITDVILQDLKLVTGYEYGHYRDGLQMYYCISIEFS